jgi:hypothetical protein
MGYGCGPGSGRVGGRCRNPEQRTAGALQLEGRHTKPGVSGLRRPVAKLDEISERGLNEERSPPIEHLLEYVPNEPAGDSTLKSRIDHKNNERV